MILINGILCRFGFHTRILPCDPFEDPQLLVGVE